MPFFSIVVPVYNTGKYVTSCLESLIGQTFPDIEIIVVDDASPDDAASVIEKFQNEDSRIVYIRHEHNKGRHSSRKSGTAAATGEYVLFVDSDDALSPDACEKIHQRLGDEPVDILHFGSRVVGDFGVSEESAQDFEAGLITNIGLLRGDDIILAAFSEKEGYRQDWRIIHRAYDAGLIKRAFDAMPDRRLNRAEDGYEYFVAASMAQTEDSADDILGYTYFYGRGITGEAPITRGEFNEFCEEFKECFDATEEYARECDRKAVYEAYDGCVAKSLELLSNDWLLRVSQDEKVDAMMDMARVFGEKAASRECYRFLRDRAYELLQDDDAVLHDDDPLFFYRDLADDLALYEPDKDDVERFRSMRDVALFHMGDLLKRERSRARIKLFVAMHTEAAVPHSRFFIPVNVGGNCAGEHSEFEFYDDEGDNISVKNPSYCELTVQYWAWKNADADYYGFCHYRRYFDFSSVPHEENPYGEIMDDYIDSSTVEKYGLNDKGITSAIEGYDVITTGINDVAAFPGDFSTLREHYDDAPFLHVKDLDMMADIVKENYPDYSADVDEYLNGYVSCFCNMYIMKKDIFFDYCEWLFPLLEEFERRVDMSLYNKEALRTPGHLAERLFNIYFIHHIRTGVQWKVKELQCVHFLHPEPHKSLFRAFDGTAVPIVFAADDNYVPQLSACILSLVDNASPDRYYDIVVLTRDIGWENSGKIFRLVTEGRPNVSMRFYNVADMVKSYKLEANAHISTETYYRFLVQSVFPGYDKVLYLDSDLVVRADVADLYDVDLGDNLLAAVPDADYAGNLNMEDGERMKYSKEVLHMKDPYAYFQAGVLLLNTRAMRRLYTMDEWLKLASVPYIYNDQDILNAQCEGRVVFLDYSWNVMVDTGRLNDVIVYAPAFMLEDYMASRENPKIVHYAGGIKPWNVPLCDFAADFWRYARQTPFYEELVVRLALHRVHDDEHTRDIMYHYIVDRYSSELPALPLSTEAMDTLYRYVIDCYTSETEPFPLPPDFEEAMYRYVVNRHAGRSFKRKVGDVFLPYGSKRREFIKRLAGRG